MNYLDALRSQSGPPQGALATKQPGQLANSADFLKLLTAQLAHQDPLNPQDSQAFVEQLATFSSLEQLTNIKNGLGELALAQSSVVSASAVDFAGRTATVAADRFDVGADGKARLGAYLSTGGDVRVKITDAAGNAVTTLELGKKDAGIVPFEWSEGEAGKQYHFTVETVNEDGSATPATALVRATVDSVSFDKGYAELRIMGRLFGLGDVLEIG